MTVITSARKKTWSDGTLCLSEKLRDFWFKALGAQHEQWVLGKKDSGPDLPFSPGILLFVCYWEQLWSQALIHLVTSLENIYQVTYNFLWRHKDFILLFHIALALSKTCKHNVMCKIRRSYLLNIHGWSSPSCIFENAYSTQLAGQHTYRISKQLQHRNNDNKMKKRLQLLWSCASRGCYSNKMSS